MRAKPQFSFRVFTNEDQNGVIKLLSETFKMSNEFWTWKYALNPNFDPSLAMVAINKNQVVGCAFWLPRNLRISQSTSARVALGADLAVDSDYKGQGIGTALIASENKILENKNVVMSYGFVEPDLVKHIHGPQIGLVSVPTSTIMYKRYLNCSKVREKSLLLNRIVDSDEKMRAKLRKMNLRVLLRLKGMPPFVVKLGPDRIDVEEDDLTNPDIKVECDSTFLALMVKSKRRTFRLVKSLLLRRIKIKTSNLGSALKLYTTLKLLQSFFTSR